MYHDNFSIPQGINQVSSLHYDLSVHISVMSQTCLFICDLELSLFPSLAMAIMHSTKTEATRCVKDLAHTTGGGGA